MKELLEQIVKKVVTEPQSVVVDEVPGVLHLTVAKVDVGRVIGREGRTIHAIRTILHSAAALNGCHVLLDFNDMNGQRASL